MPPSPWRAVVLAQALLAFGCSETAVQQTGDSGADAPASDAPPADVPTSDAPPADLPPSDVPPIDVPIGQDVPVGQDVPADSNLCAPRAEAPALALAADCSAQAHRVDPTALCVDRSVCPVVAHAALRCAMTGGYGPWIVPTRTGASVLYATNQGGFRNTLFAIPETGDPELPRLAPFSAVGRLAVDTSGRRVLVESELPGVATVHERDGVWRRGPATPPGTAQSIGTAAAFVDELNGYLAVYPTGGEPASLATLRAGCWSSRPLPGMTQALPNVGIDANARPWVSWWLYEGGRTVLRLLDPDGRTHDLRATESGGIVGNAMPVMVTDGADARRSWPALADYRADGFHVYTRGVADTAWRDRLAVAPPAEGMSNCPAEGSPPGGAACGGLTRCTEQTRGLSRAFGLARTGDGTLWAAWATHDYEIDYTLSAGGPGCAMPGIVPPRCACTRTEAARRGGATVTLARVGDASIAATARFRIDEAGVVPELAMTGRGDHVLLVVWEPSRTGTSLRYLDVDTRSIR